MPSQEDATTRQAHSRAVNPRPPSAAGTSQTNSTPIVQKVRVGLCRPVLPSVAKAMGERLLSLLEEAHSCDGELGVKVPSETEQAKSPQAGRV